MKKVFNLTPHTVTILDNANRVVFQIPPSGTVARVSTTFESAGGFQGAPILRPTYGTTEGLPDRDENTILIVSMLVAQANPDRDDLLCPNTAPSEVVRDEAGNILGVRSWADYHK